MNKLLVVVMLSAVVAVAMAATKEEMMAKKLAFKGKQRIDHKQDFIDAIQKLKELDLSPEEFDKRVAQLKLKNQKKSAPLKEDKDAILHRKKVEEDMAKAKAELAETQTEFRRQISKVRYQPDMNVMGKKHKMATMKQDFMAKIASLKERMGLDAKRTDRMAWNHAQMKKEAAPISH